MNFYFVDRDLRMLMDEAFDPETGELVMDEAEFQKRYAYLAEKKENILEDTALVVKEEAKMVKAIKEEIDSLKKRLEAHEKRMNRNESLLMEYSNCENFETEKVAVKFRPSERVYIEDDEKFVQWAIEHCNLDLITHKEKITDEPNRVAIKKWLKNGATSEFAELQHHMNVSIA